MPEELLDGPNIVSILQQMRSETMAKRMATRRFWQTSGSDRVPNGVLEIAFGDVMAALFSAPRVER